MLSKFKQSPIDQTLRPTIYPLKFNYQYTNEKIALSGRGLYYGGFSRVPYIMLGLDSSQNQVFVKLHTFIRAPFRELWITADLRDDLFGGSYLMAFPNEDQFIQVQNDPYPVGNYAVQFSALTAYTMSSRVIGVYIDSMGNLDVKFTKTGATVGFDNLPAGTYLPISPVTIENTTTCAGTLIYESYVMLGW